MENHMQNLLERDERQMTILETLMKTTMKRTRRSLGFSEFREIFLNWVNNFVFQSKLRWYQSKEKLKGRKCSVARF